MAAEYKESAKRAREQSPPMPKHKAKTAQEKEAEGEQEAEDIVEQSLNFDDTELQNMVANASLSPTGGVELEEEGQEQQGMEESEDASEIDSDDCMT
jgi:hypothetical protein